MKFTRQTIKSSYLVENPDWYKLTCTKVMDKAAQSGSTNYIFIFEGQHSPNAENPDELLGVPVTVLINENADWVMYPLAKAANGGDDFPEDSEFNPHSLEGVTVEGFVKRGLDNNDVPRNNVTEWRPVQE